MKKIYIHVGMGKTGTTAIQRNFAGKTENSCKKMGFAILK